MEEEDNNILIDLSNYYCKKCNNFPGDSKIYICMNLISGTNRCGYFYCSQCLNKIEKCLNKQCNGPKDHIKEDKALSRLFANGEELNKCNFCNGFFQNKLDLKNHIKFCTKAFYQCKFCIFQTQNMDEFWNHMIIHHEQDFVNCVNEFNFNKVK